LVTSTYTVGSRIKDARKQLGLTLPQLAHRAGVKRKTLENWEKDRTDPRADKLMRLAGVLQVSMIWLLTGDQPDTPHPVPDADETAHMARKLERALALQQDLAALLVDISADISRLQRDLDADQELAA
jgi:transcriptional regulator with XRE-family HTH domain